MVCFLFLKCFSVLKADYFIFFPYRKVSFPGFICKYVLYFIYSYMYVCNMWHELRAFSKMFCEFISNTNTWNFICKMMHITEKGPL